MTPFNATSRSVAVAACALFVSSVPAARAAAHFLLLSPDSAYEQGLLGDPQKAPPCGDVAGSKATGKVTAFEPGQTITIKIDETIYHPGHYRVALAKTRAELPAEPKVTAGSTACGSAVIDPDPSFPVLVDGALVHDAPFAGEQTIEVKLPTDVTCDDCVLQVIEFMSEHGLNNPGGCYYHHCANIALKAAAGTDSDAGSKSDAGTGSKSDAGAKTDAGTSTKDAGSKTDAGASEAASDATSDADDDGSDDDDAPKPQTDMTSGCGLGAGRGELLGFGAALLLGLSLRGRRRRAG